MKMDKGAELKEFSVDLRVTNFPSCLTRNRISTPKDFPIPEDKEAPKILRMTGILATKSMILDYV